MGAAGTPVRRARRTLAGAAALVVASMLAAGTAAGQEDPPPTTAPTSTTSSTSTTAPPATVVLEDGDIGVVPPGADEEPPAEGPPPEDDAAPDGPAEGELEVPEELPVVILPDPTPGLNAALAAIDIGRATEKLAEGDVLRREAEAALDAAFAERASAVQARRAASARLLAAKAVVDELAVAVVIRSDVTTLESLFDDAGLDELEDLQITGAVADEIQAEFDAAREAYRDAVELELSATTELDQRRTDHRFARFIYFGLRRALDEAIAEAEEARKALGPEILAPSVLDAEDLVAWYRTYYRADPPVGSIELIIDSYLRIGEEEGVAGDIAFAQAILETGGFRSGHSLKWNFAGIGAYDYCAPVCSFAFPSLDDGVRAHIHLLRAYADPGLTTAQLAAKPNRLVAPERVRVRGCCQRWTQLTGVWATDPNYDRKVLGIYRLMVEIGRARDRAQT